MVQSSVCDQFFPIYRKWKNCHQISLRTKVKRNILQVGKLLKTFAQRANSIICDKVVPIWKVTREPHNEIYLEEIFSEKSVKLSICWRPWLKVSNPVFEIFNLSKLSEIFWKLVTVEKSCLRWSIPASGIPVLFNKPLRMWENWRNWPLKFKGNMLKEREFLEALFQIVQSTICESASVKTIITTDMRYSWWTHSLQEIQIDMLKGTKILEPLSDKIQARICDSSAARK